MRFLLLVLFLAFDVISCENAIKEATDWLNQVLENRFTTDNVTETSSTGATFLDANKPTIKDGKKICTTEDNKEGYCVKSSLCDKDTKKSDPTAFILREKGCSYLQECCPKDKIRKKQAKLPAVSNAGCGWSNPGANTFREKLRNYADYGDFPWMVALLKNTAEGVKWTEGDYLGGGSLIHPSVVMTVAHKVINVQPNEIKCRAGEWDALSADEIYPHQERNITKIVIHEEYNTVHIYYDIALLILDSPFVLVDAPHMGLACLGTRLPPAGTQCYSMGWGEDFQNNKKYVSILKKIKLPLVSADTCGKNLKNTRLGPTYSLHSSFTCAGGEEGVDTCVGDGGSPLVCPIGNDQPPSTRYAVFGMVAYGLECGTKDVPGVYVNIPHVHAWVDEKMAAEKLDKLYVY